MKKELYIVIVISILTLTGCSTTQEHNSNADIDRVSQVSTDSEIERTEMKNTESALALRTTNNEITTTEIIEGSDTSNTEIEHPKTPPVTNGKNDVSSITENHENSPSKELPTNNVETVTQEQSRIKTDSRGKNGENSLAYLETLHENISQAMVNGELPFVSSCRVDEAARTVKVGISEMKDEYIQKLKEFESMGAALDIFQEDFMVLESEESVNP